MAEREEKSVDLEKSPYEEPTLVKREDLMQITEGIVMAGISDTAPVVVD